MKKFILLTALALTAGAAFSSIEAKKKSKKEKVVEPVVVPIALTTGSDSVSYAGGMAMTNGLLPYLVQQGVDTAYMADFIRGFKEIVEGGDNPQRKAYAAGMEIANQVKGRMLPGMTNEFKDSPDSIIANVFYRGFADALCGDTTHFELTAAENYFRQKQAIDKKAKEERLYGPNREAGVAFLAENAKKDSVIVTPSGLQYKVLVKGDGEVPQATDKVLVNYEGRLIDGTVFDASSKHGSDPVSFAANQVIQGWTEALTMMPVGSKWQLFIPQELAYGNRSAGQIKPYSALIFDVELVGIDRSEEKKAEPAPTATPTPKKGGKRKK